MTQAPPARIASVDSEPARMPVPPLSLEYNKVVLVMDMVESVMRMASDEVSMVRQLHRFLHHARQEVVPALGGRLVKSMGDGILAVFPDASHTVTAAFRLHRFFDAENLRRDEHHKLWLRAGLNSTHLYVDEQAVFGNGVNLAARVTSLAGPGETVVTAAVHDSLVDGLDADMVDMGESYLRHWPEPVRTWRILPVNATTGPTHRTRHPAAQHKLRPTGAVTPLDRRTGRTSLR